MGQRNYRLRIATQVRDPETGIWKDTVVDYSIADTLEETDRLGYLLKLRLSNLQRPSTVENL